MIQITAASRHDMINRISHFVDADRYEVTHDNTFQRNSQQKLITTDIYAKFVERCK